MKAATKTRQSASVSTNRRSNQTAAQDEAPADIRDAVMRLKRERIVAAAVDLFYHQGYGRTTLEQVADMLQVTKPFIYQYFDSKSALLGEICGRAIRLSHQALDRAIAQQGTPTTRLKAIARDFMLTVLNHQAHAVIYSREETELLPPDRESINALRREFDRRLVGLLQEGVAAGEFQVEDVHLTALAIGGIVGWSQVWYRSGGRLTREEASERVSMLVLAMVRAKPPARRKSAPA
jgi:TetR/AcrR family transcriptional regulator, cholesterol catabolism regulator